MTLRRWLEKGPYNLAFSSSFFGFFAHCGVAEALEGEVPRAAKLTGSSAGALVAGALASGMSTRAARELMFGLEKKDFWDPAPGFGLLRGKKFQRLLEKNFAPTFAAATTPLEVAVFDVFGMRTTFLAEGPLPRAVVASCAVPLLFHPVRIGRRIYSDGGVLHKSGIRLAHPDERTLCVFLQHDGLSDAYEMGRSLGKLGPEQKVLRLKNLPRVSPNSLGQGRVAFGEALKRTLAALDKPFRGSILDG